MSVLREDIGRRQSLYRLAIARSDIQSARLVARYAQDHVRELTDELWLPLQDALVIAYARPFTSNDPFGPIPARWEKFDNSRYQQLHKELIKMRNELVAHADASKRSVLIFPPNTQPPVPGLPPLNEVSMSVNHTRHPPEFFKSVRELCDDLWGRLHSAVQAELKALFAHIPSVPPFNLLTGEQWTIDLGGTLILSEETLPPQ